MKLTKIIVGLVACAFVFAGWRNLPRVPAATSSAAGVVFAALFVGAFVVGRRSVRAEAVAVAMASARADAAAAAHAGAQSVAQLVVNLGEGGARQVAEARHGQVEWLAAGSTDRSEQLEGSDALASLVDELRETDPMTTE